MKKLLDYRVILIIWLALGIGFSGGFYIYPPHDFIPAYNDRHFQSKSYYRPDFKPSKIIFLSTAVGTILIGGIGYVLSKKKS